MIYLIANWKMNPASVKEAEKLTKDIVSAFGKLKNRSRVSVALCPPFPYLQSVRSGLKAGVKLGAQNAYFKDIGAYTGEVSPKMLSDIKCDYVIIGHSERRDYFKEDYELINKKLKAVLKNKLTPILAVGEHAKESPSVITKNLEKALEGISAAQAKKIIIAYEPIWAIGTGKAATTDDAMTARLLIQKTLAGMYSKSTADTVPVIYGGSTNSKNISPFIMEAGMAGALVGGASLKSAEFIKMIEQIV